MDKLKDRIKDILLDFVINLIDTFQEIRARVIYQKSFGSLRKVIRENRLIAKAKCSK